MSSILILFRRRPAAVPRIEAASRRRSKSEPKQRYRSPQFGEGPAIAEQLKARQKGPENYTDHRADLAFRFRQVCLVLDQVLLQKTWTI